MCLAKAYVNGSDDLILEDVVQLKIYGSRLHLRSLFGEEREVEGKVKEIDFQNSRVVLES